MPDFRDYYRERFGEINPREHPMHLLQRMVQALSEYVDARFEKLDEKQVASRGILHLPKEAGKKNHRQT